MRPEFMDRLYDIRKAYGKPMIIRSGYRDTDHPVERSKSRAGEHTYGLACDVAVGYSDALDLIAIAYGFGIRRIGVSQKGGSRFLHLGMGDQQFHFPQSIWSY